MIKPFQFQPFNSDCEVGNDEDDDDDEYDKNTSDGKWISQKNVITINTDSLRHSECGMKSDCMIWLMWNDDQTWIINGMKLCVCVY